MTEDAFVANAADEEQVKRGQQKEKRAGDQAKADLRAVLALPAGERFIRRLVAKAKPFGLVFNDSHARMSLREGQRNFGLWLIAEVARANKSAVSRIIEHPTPQETNNG